MFCHYGIAEDEMKASYWFEPHKEKALLGNRNELKSILKKDGKTIAVFSGHQHWTKHLQENGMDYYVVGSLVENDNRSGIPEGVYYNLDVNDEDVTVRKGNLRLSRGELSRY